MIRRFNKLTEAEFTALSGTDKFANMISNKFVTDDFEVCDWLFENSIGQYCALKDGPQWIIYFESIDDAENFANSIRATTSLTVSEPIPVIMSEEVKVGLTTGD
mgnify:CR=1 FL=1